MAGEYDVTLLVKSRSGKAQSRGQLIKACAGPQIVGCFSFSIHSIGASRLRCIGCVFAVYHIAV